jgi:hypothetical protein
MNPALVMVAAEGIPPLFALLALRLAGGGLMLMFTLGL